MSLCPELGIAIPVGKDSMSMRTVWDDGAKKVVAPLSLVVSAFARVEDVRRAVTPQLSTDPDTDLLLLDLSPGKQRLGGSCLLQVYNQIGKEAPDLDSAALLKGAFAAIQELNRAGLLLAYHDRSDGGLLVSICEMAFAACTGVTLELGSGDSLCALFNEEPGALIQVARGKLPQVRECLVKHGLLWGTSVTRVGSPNVKSSAPELVITQNGAPLYRKSLAQLRGKWSDVSYRMQALRDNPSSAEQELEKKVDMSDPGLQPLVTFEVSTSSSAVELTSRPKVAILREQGVNGHVEMAAAFHRAGFESFDVHMSDVLSGRDNLEAYAGVVACGGFSYGDVLGAGQGWAKSILMNARGREAFERFFRRTDSFTLGVCNGCQMLSGLKGLIPGAGHWPRFVRNASEQFEARLGLVEIQESPSILLRGMAGSRLPVAVAHGEGRVQFEGAAPASALRFVDNHGRPTQHYPENPNGSLGGATGFTSEDGRATILMPHPERVFRTAQLSWAPAGWGELSPWFRLFSNARKWVG
jgi:phosphoribosylformylglycinamidine synthase